ncbi:hypothetical protein Drorol1_Dr00017042 [Drosera rotundifolia]
MEGEDDFISQGVQEIFLQFRAGKMLLEGKRVIPDTRKGLVRVVKGDEGLVHFQWLERGKNEVEDDQIVFPDEAIFEKVAQTSERVYILKFNTDDRIFFFWMQEPMADCDQQLCDSVNLYINRPLDESFEGPEFQESLEDMTEDDLSSRAGNLVGPSVSAELTSDVTSSGRVKLLDLQRILSSLNSGAPAIDFEDPDGGVGLADILKPELILPLLDTLSAQDQLAPFLPEGQTSSDDLVELLQSPPFRQQVDSFTYVLRTGQIDLSQFGIDPSKYKFTVLSFLEALEDSVSKQLQAQGSNDPMDEGH